MRWPNHIYQMDHFVFPRSNVGNIFDLGGVAGGAGLDPAAEDAGRRRRGRTAQNKHAQQVDARAVQGKGK